MPGSHDDSLPAQRDFLSTHDFHAERRIARPFDPERLINEVRATERFWLSIGELPAAECARGGERP